MANKNRKPRYVSPAGIAMYPWLQQPDTKFGEPGDYKIDIKVEDLTGMGPDKEAVDLEELFTSMAEEALAEAQENAKDGKAKKKLKELALSLPIEDDVDEDGEDTGKKIIKTKQKASITKKDGTVMNFSVQQFDAKGKQCPDAKVGGGSTVKASFEIVPFVAPGLGKYGVTLRLRAVQVLELVEFGGSASADAYGFDEEDGFEAPAATEGEGGEVPSTDEDF